MRAFVTGISGFVGAHLAEHLLECGDEVAGCNRAGTWPAELAHLAPHVRLECGDLTDPRAARRLVDCQPADAIFHLAGLASPRSCAADPALAVELNARGTENLCEAIGRGGQRPRIVLVSTAYLYGRPDPNHLPIRADCPIQADHPYAATKWQAEQCAIAIAQRFGLDMIRVRPFNHIGPRQGAGYIVSDWAMQIAAIETATKPPRLRVGNLDTRRDYTDVRDVVRGYRMLAVASIAPRLVNLGSGTSRSGREILEILRGLSTTEWSWQVDPALVRTGEAPEIVADPSTIAALGWQPRIALRDTLSDTLDYWRRSLIKLPGGQA